MPRSKRENFLGTYYPHDSVDLAFLVSLEGGKDLAKFKIDRNG